jgi:hypothetical protein
VTEAFQGLADPFHRHLHHRVELSWRSAERHVERERNA